MKGSELLRSVVTEQELAEIRARVVRDRNGGTLSKKDVAECIIDREVLLMEIDKQREERMASARIHCLHDCVQQVGVLQDGKQFAVAMGTCCFCKNTLVVNNDEKISACPERQ